MGAHFDDVTVVSALAGTTPGPLTRHAQALRQDGNELLHRSRLAVDQDDFALAAMLRRDARSCFDRADALDGGRHLCGSCDAGLPMSCTCPPAVVA